MTAIPHIREKPPLRHTIEVETPDGRFANWSDQETDAANVPSGVEHASAMPGGYAEAGGTLPRVPERDYPDIVALSRLAVRDYSMTKVWEGRLERAPRTSGDQMSISPAANGFQVELDDNKFATEIYVDRDLSRWIPASVQRKINLGATFGVTDHRVDADTTTGAPSLATGVVAPWTTAPGRALSEAWYDAGSSNSIGSVYFAWKRGPNLSGTDANWTYVVGLSDDDVFGGSPDSTSASPIGAGPVTGTRSATATRRFAVVNLQFANVANTASNVEYDLFWTCLAVYGDHGLTKRGTDSATDAKGVYASDVFAQAVGKYADGLTVTSDSIQPSGFVIPHLIFSDPTTCGEIVKQATAFGLQDWGVFNDKVFEWYERGTRGKTWRARVSPSQLQATGPQVDRVWNSIVVQYRDVDGTTRTVGPPGSGADSESTDLADSDSQNPATLAGLTRRDLLQAGTLTAAAATELGRRWLEESKLLDASGQAELVGWVEDDKGVVYPYSRVRAGDTIAFVDAADTSPRRIVKATHSHDERKCSVDLDAPPEGLQALQERLGVALVSLGLN